MPPVYQIPDWLLRDNKLILPPRISLLPDLPDPPGMKPVAGWRGPSAERSASSWCERARVSVGPGTPEAPPIAPGAAARPGSAPSRLRIRGVLRRRRCRREGAMEVLHPRCAGLDVHKDSVVAAVRLAETGTVHTELRRFDTTTPGLLALAAWLAECGCTHAAMEATGVYWKPVWHVLSDGERVLILANAAHVKNVPGRKTDVADAAWLADLLAHGLVRASFVPEDAPTQAMRALLRTRKQLVREQSGHVQRLQKTLEDANLKLASVLTDIMGLSGRAILEALVAGETDPERLLALVHRRVRAEPAQLRAALSGRVGRGHRFLLRLHLGQYDALAKALEEIDAEVERGLDPFRDAVRLLRTVPGIGDLAAQAIVAEIGTDMGRFPTAAHLVSWEIGRASCRERV